MCLSTSNGKFGIIIKNNHSFMPVRISINVTDIHQIAFMYPEEDINLL